MTYSRLVAFGEAMIRLTAPSGEPLETATTLATPVGGAELNAAIAARRSGLDATWVSTLPTGPLGDLVVHHAAANRIDPVLRRVEGARLGLYFLELATPPRVSQVIYDRAGSAFALHPTPRDEWVDLLDAQACLLVSGITPALSPETRQATARAIESAKSRSATVAVDINYRAALWSRQDAYAWLEGILGHVDVLAAGEDELADLGVTGDDPYDTAVSKLGLRAVIGTRKRIRGRTIDLEVTAATPEESNTTRVSAEVIDPVGAGDAMFGTFLGCLDRMPLEECVERSTGAAVSCYGLFGDALTTDIWKPDEHGGLRR